MPYAAGELRAQIATEERSVPFVLVSIGTTGHTVQVTKKTALTRGQTAARNF